MTAARAAALQRPSFLSRWSRWWSSRPPRAADRRL